MENVRRNGLSKKGSTRALVVLALAVAALLVAGTVWLLWPKSNLGIDYSTEAYRARQQKVIGPADYSEARIEAYSAYCPSAQEIIVSYSTEGLVEAIELLHAILAMSDDLVELMEINRSLLDEGGSTPVLFYDPETIIKTMGQDYSGDERKKAASEYLIALAYLKGDFEGAIGADDLNPFQVSKEHLQAVRDEGLRRLAEVYSKYPDVPLAVLARFDYLGYHETIRKDANLDDYLDMLPFVEENYPGSAFLTRCYINIAGEYVKNNDPESAIEYYQKALETPDYRTRYKNGTAHEMINELIKEIQNQE